MMKRNFIWIFFLAFGISSCGVPDMEPELVRSMIFGKGQGVFADVTIGDNWDKVKEGLHKEWVIEESELSYRMTKVWDNSNSIILSLKCDADNNILEMKLSVNGKQANEMLIDKITAEFIDKLNSKYTVQSASEKWLLVAEGGEKYDVVLNLDYPGFKSLIISVEKY